MITKISTMQVLTSALVLCTMVNKGCTRNSITLSVSTSNYYAKWEVESFDLNDCNLNPSSFLKQPEVLFLPQIIRRFQMDASMLSSFSVGTQALEPNASNGQVSTVRTSHFTCIEAKPSCPHKKQINSSSAELNERILK